MPPYAVVPIDTSKDIAGLSSSMMRAFMQDPHWALNWPHSTLEDVIEGCEQRLGRNLINGRDTKRHQKAIDTATGEIVGYIRWVLLNPVPKGGQGYIDWSEAQIDEPSAEQRAAFEELYKKGVDADGYARGSDSSISIELSPALEAAEEKITKDEPFLSLDYLTVSPDHQRSGVASMLVRSGIKQADAAGIRSIVMASTDKGKKLYEKHGFKLVTEVSQDDTKWGGQGVYTNYFLVREINATTT